MTQIDFDKECGDDNVCEPELAVSWLNVGGVVVGASQSAGVQVNATLRVRNTGETAYSVTLNVSFPRPSLQFADASPEHSVCRPFLSRHFHHRHHGRYHNVIIVIITRANAAC